MLAVKVNENSEGVHQCVVNGLRLTDKHGIFAPAINTCAALVLPDSPLFDEGVIDSHGIYELT